jgi:hypothetical protein
MTQMRLVVGITSGIVTKVTKSPPTTVGGFLSQGLYRLNRCITNTNESRVVSRDMNEEISTYGLSNQ